MSTKVCGRCKEELALDAFGVNRASKDGLQSHCRVCDLVSQAKAKEKPTNKKNRKKYEVSYREAKRDIHSWRLKKLYHAARARAKEKGRFFELTPEFVESLYPPDGRCPVYGTELVWGDRGFRENSPSIDRIDSSGGYSKDNVQIISWKANRLKAYATLEDLELLVAFMKQGD